MEGRPADAAAERACVVNTAPDFFPTMRIPLREGRLLNEADNLPWRGKDDVGDRRDIALPTVINEAAAHAFWADRSPIGAFARFSGSNGSWLEVIGVVGDTRNNGRNRPAMPEIYFPAGAMGVNSMNVVVRSELPADQLIAAVRRTIRQADPTLAMGDVRTMNDAPRRHAAARASQLAGHDVLRLRGAAHGDARHLRRVVVLRPAAHRGAGHADGPRAPSTAISWRSSSAAA